MNQPQGVSGAPLAVISRTEGVRKSQTGIYEAFLCQSCESIFNAPDRHFIDFVRRLDHGRAVIDRASGQIKARLYGPDQADPRLLRLFANSLLLRAHLTNDPFFKSVHLGGRYDRVKALVLGEIAGGDDEFSVLLMRLEGVLGRPGRSPVRAKVGGVNGYWFGLPGLRMYIKADWRPMKRPVRDAQVRCGTPVVVFHREATHKDLQETLDLTDPFAERISRILRS
ncbi:hypothetical protein [Stenotrophomonas sp. MMGLT7]|uniref:hypothetical protein n=1 Tax=Stenotrophomonas sp. MMGLT7 TaxID=2901227 RepID=UPI001E532A96|nr:hypothetical protein [Stenotrophomonas sp. MMGLT7]MCD7099132.1 hypothetical protein [Stenotrophomonas sp. MMGLT7]